MTDDDYTLLLKRELEAAHNYLDTLHVDRMFLAKPLTLAERINALVDSYESRLDFKGQSADDR